MGGGGGTVYVLEQVSYLIGHDSLLGGVSSSPLLSTAGERFNNINSGSRHGSDSKQATEEEFSSCLQTNILHWQQWCYLQEHHLN